METQFISFPGKIHVIQTDRDLELINLDGIREVGFDTETRPSFRKGEFYKVALLQLSTATDAYIIRLHYVTQYGLIKEILENKTLLKAGVAIHDDIKHLQKTFHFTPQGFVELQHISKAKGLKNIGLKGMTEELLGAKLTKGPKTTNWEAAHLTERQLMYAATDAWVSLEIYRALSLKEDIPKQAL